MGDPRDVWINLSNAVLGTVVLLILLGTLLAIAAEFVTRWNKRRLLRAELDRELRDLTLHG